MPELPEVERARKLIAEVCSGYKITEVVTNEDKLVYTGGITHEDYATELTGRTIETCERKGKIFWLKLSGDGRVPVMHFGMNGMLMLKGRKPDWYIRKPRKAERDGAWPPAKYVKFLLKLESQAGSVGEEPLELAFLDSRRLARLRLTPYPPTSHPPVSLLGFDPLLTPPTLPDFLALLAQHPRSTTKGLIMDQSFSAGVGNWVADEILYQARVHPACPVGMLGPEKGEAMWREMLGVVRVAVEANADHAKFPKDWLFSWRWSKGKKDKRLKGLSDDGGFRLPDGAPGTISFLTVGGRTSAYVEEVQQMPEGVEMKVVKRGPNKKKTVTQDGDSDLTALSASEADDAEGSILSNVEVDEKPVIVKKGRGKAVKAAVKAEVDEGEGEGEKKVSRKRKPAAPKSPTMVEAKPPGISSRSKRIKI